MKIYTYKCPNCLASINISSSKEEVKCEYCGQYFCIDATKDESKYGVGKNKKETRLIAMMICSCILSLVGLSASLIFPFLFFSVVSLVLGIVLKKRNRTVGTVGIIIGILFILILIWGVVLAIKEIGISPELMFEEGILENPDNFEDISEADIVDILNQIPEINEVAAVNSLNDKNDGLKKDDGYVAAVYYSLKEIKSEMIGYDAVIDGGNKLGGCVEIYRNETDAKKRVSHLNKGTYLGAGGHGHIRNVLIRTSDSLSPARQQEIANIIVEYIDNYRKKDHD